MRFRIENMSRTIGIFTESSDRNPEIDLCRLCREKHDCYYSIFTSNVACEITVKDALHDLVGLQITVGDGLPTTMCPLCLKKLTEFSVFKKICLESNAILRKSLPRSCFRSFEGGGADNEESEPCVETKDCIQDVIENTSEFACSAQMTEVYIPVPDCLLPRDDKLFHIKDESEDHLSEENNPMLYTTDPAGSDASDPLATDDLSDPVMYKCSSVKEDQISDDEEGHVLNDCSDGVSRKLIHQDSFDQSGIKTGSPFVKADQSSDDEGQDVHNDSIDGTTNKLPPQASDQPTSAENGELIQNQTMAMESMTEAVDIPASERASALIALLEANITASSSKKERKVMDKDIEKCGTHLADKITSCSIPDDGQFHSISRHVSKVRKDRATMTVAGETSGCDNPNTIKFFKVTNSGRSGPKAVMQEKEEINTGMTKNPGKRVKSKDYSYHCFNCGDAFNAKHDLIEHLKIHFGSGSLNIDANLSIGKHLALKTLVSRGETDSSYQPTSSKSLNKLICKRQGVRQKGNGLFKETFGGTTEKKNVRKARRSSIVDGKSCKDSPRTTKKPSCGECEWSFPKKSYLVRHIRNHTKKTPYSCSECEKSFSRNSDLINHIRIHTKEKPYSCGECEKSFSLKSNLVVHIRTHTKEKPFSCGECEKSFSRKSHLVDHIRTHTKEKPFSCGECEKSFTQKSHLVLHIRSHTKEKPYSCGECEKSFSRKSHLICHIRAHTKETPYSCNECEKSFSQKGHLVNHIQTHTKETLFSCNECEKSFSVRSNLLCHMRIHTKKKPYSCGECVKSFSQKSHLIRHIRTHTKEKPYSCSECEKSFSQKSNLVVHSRTHTKKKPYSCNECEKSYTTKHKLILHMRVHRKEPIFLH